MSEVVQYPRSPNRSNLALSLHDIVPHPSLDYAPGFHNVFPFET